MRFFETIPVLKQAAIAFIAFAAVFTFFRGDIGDLGAKALIATGELPASALSEDSTLLPTRIYADNKLGANNHGRRAFRPINIAGKQSNATLEVPRQGGKHHGR